MRILLVRLREIGDVVFTTPAIAGLRQHYPDAHITYLVEPAAEPVVAHNPHLSEVIVAPRTGGRRGLAADFSLARRLRRERFDLAIDFHGGPRASLLTRASAAPVRVGYRVAARSWLYTVRVARPRELRARHSVENQWDLLEAIGIERPTPAEFPVQMPSDPAATRRVLERLARAGAEADSRPIVVHVSAGNPVRRWPLEAVGELVAALAADPSHRVVVTSGPSEQAAAAQVIARARAAAAPRAAERVLDCGELSLAELRALRDYAAVYIGGDSGPLHIAATSRVPIVALYGPTLPARSAPWRARELTAETVETAGLPCRPCDQRVCAPGDFRCLARISPRDVLTAVERALAAPSG